MKMKKLKNNPKLVEIFEDMSHIFSMQKVQWKPQAYIVAAKSIEQLKEDVSEIYKKQGAEGVEKISGVGEGIGKKIIEFLKTGKIKHYEELKKSISGGLLEIMKIPGMGPRKAQLLFDKLGIRTVSQLKKAAKAGQIRKLATFKEQTEKNILENIGLYQSHRGRMPLDVALKEAGRILEILKKVQGVKRVSEAGSVRRRNLTIGDLDLLVSGSKPEKVVDRFCKLKDIKKVLAKGDTKASIILKNNLQIDLRVIPDEEFGSALQYFTGNKAHNILLRRVAMKKGMKLNEYGLFKGKTRIAGKNEKEIYDKLNVKFVKPGERQGMEEVKEIK